MEDIMIYDAEKRNVTMAITGESLISRQMKVFTEKQFLALKDVITSADVSFTNAEMLFHNYEDAPSTVPGGTYMRCDPQYIEDLKWMGFDIVATANNHAWDFGENGVLTNIQNLDKYGLPYAGTGVNLASASAPTYLDTNAGRVALISATTSGPPGGRAGDQRRDVRGRPGPNYIRWTTEWNVDEEMIKGLKLVADKLGWSETMKNRAAKGAEFEDNSDKLSPPSDDLVYFLDHASYQDESYTKFVKGSSIQKRTYINESDLKRNVERVSDAKRMSDWVLFTVHNHEGGATENEPSDHIKVLAHAVIDAGADMFIGHGPHQDRGIEIYKGKPIFYSLGDFILQNDTVELMPHDNMIRQNLSWEGTPADFYDARDGSAYTADKKAIRGQTIEPIRWESAVATVQFEKGEMTKLELLPIDLGYGKERSQRGRPVLASGQVAKQVLERFQSLSEPFGTKITIDGDKGIINL